MVEFKLIKCDTCGSNGRPVLKIDEFDIFECNNCGLRYVNPQPSQEYLKNFYSENYYDNYSPGGYLETESQVKGFWKDQLEELEKNYDKREANLLEIGSACGLFLKYCRERGWENISGVELSEWSSKYASDNFNLNVQSGDINDISLEDKSYSIIVMWATIEHLREPRKTVAKIHKLLKPGGVLILNTGNDEPVYRPLSTGYSMWYHVPEHLYFYNSKAILILLQQLGYININIVKDKLYLKEIMHLILSKIKKMLLFSDQINNRSDFGKLMTISGYKPEEST